MDIYEFDYGSKCFSHRLIITPDLRVISSTTDENKKYFSTEKIYDATKLSFINLKDQFQLYSTNRFALIESISFESLLCNLNWVKCIPLYLIDYKKIYNDERMLKMCEKIKCPCDIFSQEQINTLFLLKEMI